MSSGFASSSAYFGGKKNNNNIINKTTYKFDESMTRPSSSEPSSIFGMGPSSFGKFGFTEGGSLCSGGSSSGKKTSTATNPFPCGNW